MTSLCRLYKGLIQLTLVAEFGPSQLSFADEIRDDTVEWVSTSNILQFSRPELPKSSIPWLEPIRAVMVRSLQSADQARDMVSLQSNLGTKALSSYAKYVGPIKNVSPTQKSPDALKAVMKSVRLYAQKETKVNIFPQSLKDGLRFNIGGGSRAATASRQGFVHNGNPDMRYGLRLTGIEPSQDSLKLANLSLDDYQLLKYAPKARVVYEIGEVYPEAGARSFPADAPMAPLTAPTLWQTLPSLPEVKFSGRMAPRGLPGPGSPLPPQSVFLDQSQGYYQMEAQLSGSLKQEAVLHRFRLPLWGKMNYRQERNKDWQYTKTTFENIYYSDQGYAVNLERYHAEQRFQLGLQFHQPLRNLELYAHVPDKALNRECFWREHRWETRFDFHF